MASGAGHDAQILAQCLPAAMLFVPSIGGRSHTVTENTRDEDIVLGCQVLADAVERILDPLAARCWAPPPHLWPGQQAGPTSGSDRRVVASKAPAHPKRDERGSAFLGRAELETAGEYFKSWPIAAPEGGLSGPEEVGTVAGPAGV